MPTWFDANVEERTALFKAMDAAKAIIDKDHRPDAYNIGINCGAAAGQTIFHLHVHLIPRYSGDVADPRGGVRHAGGRGGRGGSGGSGFPSGSSGLDGRQGWDGHAGADGAAGTITVSVDPRPNRS
jgi:hypothetical protein